MSLLSHLFSYVNNPSGGQLTITNINNNPSGGQLAITNINNNPSG